ncbi:MAG: hypothetical protein B7Y39_10910 [Bdellovibrio sp. 28-41-41]|nr:MAG: hypothetical protein B7Y39_10910 [Bdellovibrio sp. 28-41-41]
MISPFLLKHIELGNWVIGEVSAHLIRQFQKIQVPLESEPGITARSLSYYRKVELRNCLISSKSQGVADLTTSVDAVNAVNSIFKQDVENGELSVGFDSIESEKINSALSLIKKTNETISRLLTSNISLFLKADRVHFRSASHPHLMGAIILGKKAFDQTLEGLATSIVHELAHQELYLLNLLDRLVIKEFDFNQIHAPFQGRKRPPIGRLHSMWALYRMVRFQNDLNNSNERFRNLLIENCEAFNSNELTDFGRFLVSITAKQVA